ncbi:MAG: hypothetical protein RMJ66_08200 [Bacteroidia bacterium]|nr:hypothetical protein [Bacteroidia bacterium]MDW8135028.1 hypothetical protein [Bacteroidia bacterium]
MSQSPIAPVRTYIQAYAVWSYVVFIWKKRPGLLAQVRAAGSAQALRYFQ